ncbi:MAG: hypothetical protein U0231_09405 [Nitrospiraceae bacterium]
MNQPTNRVAGHHSAAIAVGPVRFGLVPQQFGFLPGSFGW